MCCTIVSLVILHLKYLLGTQLGFQFLEKYLLAQFEEIFSIQKRRILKTKKCNAREFVDRHVRLKVNREHENDRGPDIFGKWGNGDMRKRESEVL